MDEAKQRLFQEFPPVSPQAWTDKIVSDLKGASFEKKLIWKTGEGIDVNPFYTMEDLEGMTIPSSLPGEFPFVRGTKTDNSWLVRQDIDVDDYQASNEKAKFLIKNGVTSLGFHLKSDSLNAENMALLLDGICPEKTELNFRTCICKAAELTRLLVDYFKTIDVNLSDCHGSIEYNPFKKPLAKGVALDTEWINEAIAIINAGEALPHYRLSAVDACLLNDAGATIVQEAGYALAWGNELIRHWSQAGMPVEQVAKKIKFNFGVSSNYFLEIAKFRAVRWLWAEIVKGYDCPTDNSAFCTCSSKMNVHARTSMWNMTIYDAHVNLLRTQTEAMSAALAGVDSITIIVPPFNGAGGCIDLTNDFSERIARNQQLLLKEECHFDQVVDPAAGSYYIEALTQSIAEAARHLFVEVKERGGFTALANNGEIQRAVNEASKIRKNKLATRQRILVGTNQYPNFAEKMADTVTVAEAGNACAEGSISKLDFSRGASEFEALRFETEKRIKAPKVFLLPIGNHAMRLARAQFSSNFFSCAGFEIIDNSGYNSIEEGINAAFAKNADIIVLCSSDDEYATYAPEANRLIANKALLVVAGTPACMDDLKAIGIEYFIHVKSNVIEFINVISTML